MIRFYLPFTHLRRRRQISERVVAEGAALSRGAVRQLSSPDSANVTAQSMRQLAEYFERDVDVVLSDREIFSDYSTVALAFKVSRDGFDSWKTHLFDLVDEFRRTADARLVLLPPPASADKRLVALVAATVRTLCDEVDIAVPPWALRRHYLTAPWFVSGMNSLKASAIVESPLAFRANNIFVHGNFLERA